MVTHSHKDFYHYSISFVFFFGLFMSFMQIPTEFFPLETVTIINIDNNTQYVIILYTMTNNVVNHQNYSCGVLLKQCLK